MRAIRGRVGKLHSTYRWQQKRARQLAKHPLCRMCMDEGRVTKATVADHIKPHRDDPDLFWNGELQSLCGPHHNSTKQALEKGGKPKPMRVIGVSGWPIE